MEAMFTPLQRYADFSGRSNRKEYWLFVLGLFLTSVAIDFLSFFVTMVVLISHTVRGSQLAVVLNLVPLVLRLGFVLGTFIPSLSVLVRRLHDTNRSGSWILLLIPIFLMLLVGGLMGFIVNQSYFGNARGAWGLLRLVSPFLPLTIIVAPIAAVAALTLFIFMVLKGSVDVNRFGPPPGEPSPEDEMKSETSYAPAPARLEQVYQPNPLPSQSLYHSKVSPAVFGKRR